MDIYRLSLKDFLTRKNDHHNWWMQDNNNTYYVSDYYTGVLPDK